MASSPAHPELAWRPVARSDFGALARLTARSNAHDDTPVAWSEEQVGHDLIRPELVLERDTMAGFDRDGELRAFGAVDARSSASRMLRVLLWGDVDPAWRRRGIGSALLRWSEQAGARRIAEQGARLDPSIPRLLAGFVEDRLSDRIALWRSRGFEVVRYFAEMARPVSEPVPELPAPEGIHVVPWTTELDAEAGDAHNEAFLDHWGSEPNSPEEWRHHHREAPSFRGDLSRLALDGGRVVGYVMAHRFPDDDALTGLRSAWLQTIGTRRAYRRRGIAGALIAATLRAFREADIERAELGVDAENPSGAFGLYERLGFQTLRRHTMFGRYLPAGDDGPRGDGPPAGDRPPSAA